MTEQEYEAFKNFIHELLYERMTLDDYEIIMRRLGANKRGDRYNTICHNINSGGYNLVAEEKLQKLCGAKIRWLILIQLKLTKKENNFINGTHRTESIGH